MQITAITAHPRPIKLKTPFKLALGELSAITTLIIKVETDTGMTGFGEASPYAPVNGETNETEQAALPTFAEALVGADPRNLEQVHARMDAVMAGHTALKCGIDVACSDILGKSAGMPLWQLFGGDRNTITTDITIPIGSAEEMAATAQQYVSAGFTALKLKAGNDELADIAAIKAVSAAVGPNVSIKVDANQAWTAAQTRRIMAQLKLPNLIALEQPLPDWQLKKAPALRQELAVPLMLDESVHNAHDASAAVKLGASDLINIKLAKSGGFAGANAINAIAAAAGIGCMVGCNAETRLGTAASAHFIAAHANVRYGDVDSFMLLEETDWLTGGFEADGETLTLSDRPGLGVEVHL